MGKEMERKKEKKERSSPSDVRERTLKEQQQKRNLNSAPHSAPNYPTITVPVPASGPAPLRRSRRLNPNPVAEEIDADESGAAVNKCRRIGSMTDDQRVRYREQVYKSDGFDVDSMPGVKGYGLIRPLILSNIAVYSRCKQVSQRTIDQYNRRRKQRRTSFKSETTPQLKFVRVLKAMVEDCDLIRYYVTFEAEIQGKTKIYQTLARWSRFPVSADNFSLLLIREYKKEKEKGKGITFKGD